MTPLLPLELAFEKKAKEDKASFPNIGTDYVAQYNQLLNHLRTNVYPFVDSGLAALSETPGIYTIHNAQHFDEVVRYAGILLGEKANELSSYELYILLVAIRVHDVGNALGREDHEKHCFSILQSCGAAAGVDNPEKKIIGQIAQAHGGRTPCGKKDTIGIGLSSRKPIASTHIRPQLLAAIVRLADEICENSTRAPHILLQYDSIPEHNKIYHVYAKAIAASSIDDGALIVRFNINIKDIIREWGYGIDSHNNVKKMRFVDYVISRLEKMDRERRYCNRFTKDLYTIDKIRASIEVVDDQHDILEEIPIPELLDSGYPEEGCDQLKEQLSEYIDPYYWTKKYAKEFSDD